VKNWSVDEQTITSRAWSKLSCDDFANDLAASTWCSNLDALVNLSVDDMAKLYSDVLTALLNRHCPSVKVRRRAKQNAPWFDAECRTARRQARAAERRFQRSHSDVDRQAWAEKLRLLRTLYEQKNSDFWRREIAANKGDSRRLWQTFKNVLGVTPTADCDAHTDEDFAHFFQDKVETVRASSSAMPPYDVAHRSTTTITDRSVVTSEEVEKLITPKQDMSVGPSTHVACERQNRATVGRTEI